ncbi:MAG: flagellar hook-length control protein FliK [Candidatus Zixiibacteriota bacterium]
MNQTPVNIFELLLGSIGTQPTGQNSAGSEASGLFGDIFGQYLSRINEPGAKALLASGEENSLPAFDALFGLAGKTIGETAGSDSKSAHFGQEIMSQAEGAYADHMKGLMAEELGQLPEGNYRILDSNVSGGKLTLHLENENLPGQTIKLVLPTDSLANLTNTASQRVALDGITADTAKLDNMLSQLNLKELRIESAAADQQAKQPMQISLLAESSSGELQLRASLDKSRIRAYSSGSINSTTDGILESSDSNKSQIPKILETMQAVNGVQGKGSITLQPQNDYYLGAMIGGNAKASTLLGSRIAAAQPDLFTYAKDSTDKGHTSNAYESLQTAFATTDTRTVIDSNGNRVIRSDVRFIMPADIKTSLKPNGQSVTLRIEPENLGPARLSLSLKDDKLTARISVESAPAKAALESNLDRLVTQLTKADINVDQIEITITGDSAHNEFFQRQPHWHHRVTYRSSQSDDINLGQPDIVAPDILTKAAQYAGPAGVNLLA